MYIYIYIYIYIFFFCFLYICTSVNLCISMHGCIWDIAHERRIPSNLDSIFRIIIFEFDFVYLAKEIARDTGRSAGDAVVEREGPADTISLKPKTKTWKFMHFEYKFVCFNWIFIHIHYLFDVLYFLFLKWFLWYLIADLEDVGPAWAELLQRWKKRRWIKQ